MEHRSLLRHEQLDMADLLALSGALGDPLLLVMEYSSVVQGEPARPMQEMLARVQWAVALITVRLNQVIDYDAYVGDFLLEQLTDWKVEWEADMENGHEPEKFVQAYGELLARSEKPTLIDQITHQLMAEFLLLETGATLEQVPLLSQALIVAEPSPQALAALIDRLLISFALPLRNVTYCLTEGDTLHSWKTREIGAVADTGKVMTDHLAWTFDMMALEGGQFDDTVVAMPDNTYPSIRVEVVAL